MQRVRSFVSSLVVSAMLLATLPFAAAGTPEAPEMPDRIGDVDPLSLVGLKPSELEDVQGNASMFDIVNAYVAAENPTGFWFVITVHDLDGGLQSPDRNVTAPPMHATFEVHFRSGESAFLMRAVMEAKTVMIPSPAPPPAPPVPYPYLAANFTLHEDDLEGRYVNQLFGAVSPQHEAVMAYIPKIMIGDPKVGDVMDGLYAVSKFRAQAMDHAPDASVDPTSIDPSNPLNTLLKPTYGETYEFGQFPGSGAPAKLELKAEGDTTATAQTDETVELALSLRNMGTKPLEIQIGTINPRGWSVLVEPQTLTLEPGSSDVVVVQATPSAKAGAQGILKVMASSGYETQTVAFILKHGGATGTTGTGVGGPGGPGSGPNQSLGDGDDAKDSPGVGALLAVSAIAAALVVLRRRR